MSVLTTKSTKKIPMGWLVMTFVSLAWPDRFSSLGAYQLELISACSEKGLVQNE